MIEWISTLKSTIILKAENEIKAMTTIEGNISSNEENTSILSNSVSF